MKMAVAAVRIGLRGAQLICSLAAFVKILTSFHTDVSDGRSSMLGSHAAMVAMVVTYTTTLYSIYNVVGFASRLPQLYHVAAFYFDSIMAISLSVAGVFLARSDYVVDCDAYGFMLNCDNLEHAKHSVVLANALFLASIALNYCGDKDIRPSKKNDRSHAKHT